MEELRVAVVNWEVGGIDRDTLSRERWRKSVDALSERKPHLVLCQEMTGVIPARLNEHLWRTANLLEMFPLIGPRTPGAGTDQRTAILIDTSEITIRNQGPLSVYPWTCWNEAVVVIPDMFPVLHVYSVHMTCRSATLQMIGAETLANLVADHREPSLLAGDWNAYSGEKVQNADLDALPAHLIPTRMHVIDGTTRVMNTQVHDVLTAVGLRDMAALLLPDNASLAPTSITGVSPVDRGYVTPHLVQFAYGHENVDTGGSDHNLQLFTLRSGKRM